MPIHQPNMYSIALETKFESFCGVLLPSGTTCHCNKQHEHISSKIKCSQP